MLVNNDVSRGGSSNAGLDTKRNGQAQSSMGWKDLKPASRKTKGRWRRRIFIIVTTVLLLTLIFATVRAASVASSTNEQLSLTIGGQQEALLDLRQSIPISPYLNGVNVFPEEGSSSVEASGLSSGFMSYGPEVVNGLKSANVSFLRFPGGSWGEQQPLSNHILSYQQLYDFSTLLNETGAQGMIQARVSSPSDRYSKYTSLQQRALLAGDWVDFMNNPKSQWRTRGETNIHPVMLWSVGNEPDRLIDPETNKLFTVKDYIEYFIQFSIAMHNNDPQIKVFGPELSQFEGVGVGPRDSNEALWMETFLQGVAAYEKAHKLPYHLLDGVSFHAYPLLDAQTSPSLLMTSPEQWYYMLPQLRQTIRQIMGRDLPVAITEINSTPSSSSQAVKQPSIGNEALWWADTLGTLMNEQADYVAYFSAQGVENPYPLFTGEQSPQQTATYRVFQLFSHLQANLIPLQIQHDPVDAFATVDNARQAVSILFVNKSNGNQTADISPVNQFFGFSSWQSQEISIAAYSIVLITLHRNGGAEAYSFDVPTTNSPTQNGNVIEPLQQTVCGSKYDPLAFTTPC